MAEFMPTPEQIRQACLEIQRGWSEETRKTRCAYPGIRDPVLPHGWRRAAVETVSRRDAKRFRESA